MQHSPSVVVPFHILCVLILSVVLQHSFAAPNYHFEVKEASYTRLCSTKKILTVNGQFPGPTISVRKGDIIYVKLHNKGRYNISIHWHGVKLPRYPWSDGPSYITQCPIEPGKKFNQKLIFFQEEGTLWWHAHSDWSRATVYGAIIIRPKQGASYPFTPPHAEIPILLGEWWKKDVMQVLKYGLKTGGDFNVSDAYTINGHPGDLYPCSKSGTFKLNVELGKTYLLRIINAAMNDILFFAVAKHKLTVIGADASYTKPLTSNYIIIAPGQSIDALLYANQSPSRRYFMAARAYSTGTNVVFDNTTTTAIVQYSRNGSCSSSSSTPLLPYLPYFNDTNAAFRFFGALRSLASKDHPADVPRKISKRIVSTVSINTFPCPNNSCAGPNGTRLAASMNNISFQGPPLIDVLEAYYYHIKGVFGTHFPSFPPYEFNFTAEYLPLALEIPRRGTEVRVLPYGAEVEVVFQDTNVVTGLDHPMHLHGYSFYVVGWGVGNFDKTKDPLNYNLVDPVFQNTVIVPKSGWISIRFKATNPGVWYLHCHLERHLTWGMDTVFIVKNGKEENETILPPPPDMPPCCYRPRH